MNDISKGQIVFSKAGRDKSHFFVVIDFIPPYVYVADGKLRRIESLKKKKEKHISVTSYIDENLKVLLEKSHQITNADIKKSLNQYYHKANLQQ